MFEARWLRCDEPEMMLRYILGKTGDRKFRLFACACVRRIWPLLRDERSRLAVHRAERYADHPGGLSQLRQVRTEARSAGQLLRGPGDGWRDYPATLAARAAEATVEDTGWDVARKAAQYAAQAIADSAPEEHRAQCDLLRDAFGNPFHPIALNPAWLRWHDGCVVSMARAIYEEWRFEEMPILADALEEAGCDDEEILWHCREEPEHARGCWLLDAILGKK
ncbi:MAG TPA: hypothetical protein VH682_23970 [Gemmataceae bacterium]|jgi:hypothetical protein